MRMLALTGRWSTTVEIEREAIATSLVVAARFDTPNVGTGSSFSPNGGSDLSAPDLPRGNRSLT